jgi:hypothetical protein
MFRGYARELPVERFVSAADRHVRILPVEHFVSVADLHVRMLHFCILFHREF